MAEDKKEKPKGWNLDFIEGAVVLLFLTSLIGGISSSLIGYLSSGEISFFGYNLSGIINFFRSNIWLFKILGFMVAGGAAFATFFYNLKADAISVAQRTALYPANMPMNAPEVLVENKNLSKWQKIIKLSESENSSDWRLSIIEADIMLDELLEKLKLPGDTMGEKLKAVEPSDFLTLDQAWEAHKARNMIAHEGGDFLISQREIYRIISLYEAVFKEFHLI